MPSARVHTVFRPVLIVCLIIGMGLTILAATQAPAAPLPPAGGGPAELRFTFDGDSPGAAPARLAAGFGGSSGWTVRLDMSAPSTPHLLTPGMLSNMSAGTMCLVPETLYEDVEVTVRFRADDGKGVGGLIFRAVDPGTYLVFVVDAGADRCKVVRVSPGDQKELAVSAVRIDAGRWYRLTARMITDQIQCYVEKQQIISVRDDIIATPGRAGLYAEGSGVVSFDDLFVKTAELKP